MDARARKISETMRARKLDNFKRWRDEMKRQGKIKNSYPALRKDGNLAELIGTTLGDGHVAAHPRCDSLRITGDAAKMHFVYRSAMLIETVFNRKPSIGRKSRSNAVTVTMYERRIARRLGIPYGSRASLRYDVPLWIQRSRAYRLRFLRGLYEAEGNLTHHAPTYTHKLQFTNANPHLLRVVAAMVEELGFTVCISANKVQVSRKEDVQKLADLIEFRHYDS